MKTCKGKILFINGKKIFVLDSKMCGKSHVSTDVVEVKMIDGEPIFIGTPKSNYGGFKFEKDFNYEISERLALENCVARM